MSKSNKNVPVVSEEVVEVRKTTAELKAEYAVAKEEARAVFESVDGSKFKFPSAAEYRSDYNTKWELAHPNDADALPSVTDVLSVVDDAIAATVVAKVDGLSKMAQARIIFAEELATKGVAGLSRKTILQRFQDEAGCKPKGANTYYNTCRDENGLVTHKS